MKDIMITDLENKIFTSYSIFDRGCVVVIQGSLIKCDYPCSQAEEKSIGTIAETFNRMAKKNIKRRFFTWTICM